ncbi:MAG: leucyl/phenylalanyl-tRNA--protein transferase [Candidatus Riflebacteria bacterium]|nr:leucyl/phenylalanyl-tRNA--protein transferase [Candidatus Riflebacteria bacterium]
MPFGIDFQNLFRQAVIFPHPSKANSDGLLAIGGTLSPENLLRAYASGIFPWTVHPVTWWSLDPRGIIEIGNFHVPARLERTIKQNRFKITFDHAFKSVMQGCAQPRPNHETTWVVPEFIEAYSRLHELGHAHSVEAWFEGKLAGGVYGVSVGGFFAGESMFHTVTDAGKIALVALVRHLQARGFELFDTQQVTPATCSLGAIEIPRKEYLARLASAIALPVTFSEPH